MGRAEQGGRSMDKAARSRCGVRREDRSPAAAQLHASPSHPCLQAQRPSGTLLHQNAAWFAFEEPRRTSIWEKQH